MGGTGMLITVFWFFFVALAALLARRRGYGSNGVTGAGLAAFMAGPVTGMLHSWTADRSVITIGGESVNEPTPWGLLLVGCAAAVALLCAALPQKAPPPPMAAKPEPPGPTPTSTLGL